VLIANRFEYTTLSCDKYNQHAKPCHRIDVRICNNPVEYISVHQVETHKISILSETSSLLCLLKEKLETIPGIELTSSERINVDIMKLGVTKGEGLRILASHLGVSLDECIAIGNNDNDISMIEVSGVGIAMKNGTELLKKTADVITTYDNQTDGVADILETYCILENYR
jgi:hydroxymethylpyrimidine pyrophosphatase-like HAD family hydrolase